MTVIKRLEANEKIIDKLQKQQNLNNKCIQQMIETLKEQRSHIEHLEQYLTKTTNV